jgi:hypothetical protein
MQLPAGSYLLQAKVLVQSNAATNVFCSLSGVSNTDQGFVTLSPVNVGVGTPIAKAVVNLMTYVTVPANGPFVFFNCSEDDPINAQPTFTSQIMTAMPIGTINVQ